MTLQELFNRQNDLNQQLIKLNTEIFQLSNNAEEKNLEDKKRILINLELEILKLEEKITNMISTANFKDNTCYQALNIILRDLSNIKSNYLGYEPNNHSLQTITHSKPSIKPSMPPVVNTTKIPDKVEQAVNSTENNTTQKLTNHIEPILKNSTNDIITKTSINKYGSNKYTTNNTSEKPSVKKINFEFKLGINVLYIIGIILILISLITFGRYVYVNFMSDVLKGICLFGIAALLIIVGETLLKNKNFWLSLACLTIGVSELYIALIVNYLFLGNINSIVALIFTAIITGISMYISQRNASNLLRILSLIGGYLCLVPLTTDFPFTESLITSIMLISLTASNILFPIKNSVKVSTIDISFEEYSSVISLLFYFIFSFILHTDAVIILAVGYLSIYNLMFINNVSEERLSNHIILSASSLIIPLYLITSNSPLNMTLTILLLMAVELVSLFKAKHSKYKWTFYIQFIISALIYLLALNQHTLFSAYIGPFLGFSALLLITGYTCYKNKNNITTTLFLIVTTLSLIDFIYCVSLYDIFPQILYMLSFISVFIIASTTNVNSKLTKITKYILLIFIEIFILSIMSYLSIADINILLTTTIFAYIFLCIINFIPLLRANDIVTDNTIYLTIVTIITLLVGFVSDSCFYVSTVLLITSISFFMTDKFINIESFALKPICKNKPFSYSIFSTYIIFRFMFTELFINTNGIIISILLMVVAFLSVYFGFKLNTLSLRRYGLALSLFVCAKILLADFYNAEFMAKTFLFLIVGILALSISYVYNKLENELKDSDK